MRYAKTLALGLTFLLVPSGVGKRYPDAYDFCAVRLSVTDADDGQPIASGVADLIDPSGAIVQTREVKNGEAEFCDFGFGEYSIRIHDEQSQCLATEIRNIQVIYGFTYKLKAELNTCPGKGDYGPGTACPTYIRVTSPDGQPIKAVVIKEGSTGQNEFTDTYGRAELSVPLGRTTEFTFLEPGYKPQRLRLSCGLHSHGFGTKTALIVLQPEEWNKKDTPR